MRLAYQVTLTAAGDEINKIMRFRQRERREKKGKKRRAERDKMKEKAARQTDGKRGEKEEDVIFGRRRGDDRCGK